MSKTYFIKNMVCDRCKMVVESIFREHNIKPSRIKLGSVEVDDSLTIDDITLAQDLKKNGFEIIQDPNIKLIEEIKTHLLLLVEQQRYVENFSTYLENSLQKEYSTLSRSFKKVEGQTIEKFFIKIKLEKVKELIQMGELSFSEIAYQLDYKSISHLSTQFKHFTGITMSAYKSKEDWGRNALDKII